MAEKQLADAKHLEVLGFESGGSRARQVHYKPVTDEEKAGDRKVNFKLDIFVTAVLGINFILCGIDKTNVGFVATSSFVKDAGLKKDDMPNSLSLFSATYVPLQPLSTMAAHIFGPRNWISAQLFVWGALCMAHAGYADRLTTAPWRSRVRLHPEWAGYLSTINPKYKVGFRMGLFSGMYSVAGAFAGLIAYGFLHLESPRLHGWQALFLFEGDLTVLMAVLTFFCLPTDLGSVWFLNETERQHAVRRFELDLEGTQELADVNGGLITGRDITDVLKDWKKLFMVACNVLAILPVTAFTTFLPLVVEGMGYEGVKATLMSVPPFVVGVVGLLIFVWSSDHFKERSLHASAGMLLGLVGCVIMATTSLENDKLRYGFTFVCLSGIFASGPLIAVWLAGNMPWRSTRSVVLGINGWSNLAGVIAGQIFKSKYAPSYKTPLIITMALLAVGIVGFVFVRIMLMRTNQNRAATLQDWDETNFEEAMSTERRGDQRLTFIYALR